MPGRYIALVSPHGLIRAREPELGRDADTGGQVLYVLELARALARHPAVEQVDLLTRQIHDRKVDPAYGQAEEPIAEGATLVRLPFGPRRYLRKEVLWPYLDMFVDRALAHFRARRRVPDLIHSHYADAGYVGSKLTSTLGIPLVHTGHSLGRVKRQRLLAEGQREDQIVARYHIDLRIRAEELTLDHAAMVIASTHQEVSEQYGLYENHHPERMVVIPPGVDLSRFRPPADDDPEPAIQAAVDRFFRDPDKPLVLALARPDPRKNLCGLVRAFGARPELREQANLAIVAGTRADLDDLEPTSRQEIHRLFAAIDETDLYGHVAYPRQHRPEDVPELFRLAARRRGLFVNAALTEPFGLTLLEAAASGLPVLATNDGGPHDILEACRNGLLIDPLDREAIAEALVSALGDAERRERWARDGARNVREHYDWDVHVASYLEAIGRIIRPVPAPTNPSRSVAPLAKVERLIVSDVDHTLLGDDEALAELMAAIDDHPELGFGVATGRNLASALAVLEEHGVRMPDLVISGVGAQIHYGPRLNEDSYWPRHLDYRWQPEATRALLERDFGAMLQIQPASEQLVHKISFDVKEGQRPKLPVIRRRLREEGLHVRLVFSHDKHLDVLPIRCSKGKALRWVAMRWGLAIDRILVAGDSASDEDMLRGNPPAVVVANHTRELAKLRGLPAIYFAERSHAGGVLEGAEIFGFLGDEARFEPTAGDPERDTRAMEIEP